MATIYDGVRVFSAADGANILAADHNDYQDKMILGMEARSRSVSLASGTLGDAGGWSFTWTIAGAPDLRWTSAGANSEILFPVPLRVGEYVTLVEAYIGSTAGNPTGGVVTFYEMDNDGTAAAAVDYDMRTGANFWDTDGSIVKQTSGAIAVTGAAIKQYFVGFAGPAVTDGTTATIYGIEYTSRFHVGT